MLNADIDVCTQRRQLNNSFTVPSSRVLLLLIVLLLLFMFPLSFFLSFSFAPSICCCSLSKNTDGIPSYVFVN